MINYIYIMKNSNIILKIYMSVIAILLAFMLFRSCNSKPIISTSPIHDTIYKKEAVQYNIFNKLKLKNDSLLSLKPKLIVRYKTVYDSLRITDTLCKGSIRTLYSEFTKVTLLNDSIIKNDSLAKVALINIIGLKQDHITLDSTFIATVPGLIKKAKRKGFWKGFKWGAASYAVIREGVSVVTKVLP